MIKGLIALALWHWAALGAWGQAVSAPASRFSRDLQLGEEAVLVRSWGVEGSASMEFYQLQLVSNWGLAALHTGLVGGVVEEAWATDLDGDGDVEVSLVVRVAGSGAYGELLFFEREGEEWVPRSTPALPAGLAYRGRDRFAPTEAGFERTLPLYGEEDPNCCPTGGLYRLSYRYAGNRLAVEGGPVLQHDWVGEWLLTRLDDGSGAETKPGAEWTPTAEFTLGPPAQVRGLAGCNRYSAAWFFVGPKAAFQEPAVTRMYCGVPAERMGWEGRYLAALAQVASGRQVAQRLELLDAEGRVLLVFAKAAVQLQAPDPDRDAAP